MNEKKLSNCEKSYQMLHIPVLANLTPMGCFFWRSLDNGIDGKRGRVDYFHHF